MPEDRGENVPYEEYLQYLELKALAAPNVGRNENFFQDGNENDNNVEGEHLIRLPPLVSIDDHCSLTRSLNLKCQYYAHVMHYVANSNKKLISTI